MAGPDGRPTDVDREFVSLFMIFDENVSWFLDQNIQTFTTDPKHVKKLQGVPADPDGLFSIRLRLPGREFSIKYQRLHVRERTHDDYEKGRARALYLVTLGGLINTHTPHWHGNVVLARGRRTDVLELSSAEMQSVDMVPDNPGTWMYHCHFDDHMNTGMVALYKVER